MKKINLMLSGVCPQNIPKGYWFAVDGGANYLLKNNIVPIKIYGDIDSFNKQYVENIELVQKTSQDLTDFEFAILNIINDYKNLEEINIYGATGRRLDHFLGNIMILNNKNIPNNIVLKIIDDNNIIYKINKGVSILREKINYKYISFVPLKEQTVVTIKNAKYEAEVYELTMDRANATSNEFLQNKNIYFITNKECLVIYSKD